MSVREHLNNTETFEVVLDDVSQMFKRIEFTTGANIDNQDPDKINVEAGSGEGGVLTPINHRPLDNAINTSTTLVLYGSPYYSLGNATQELLEVEIYLHSDLVNPIHSVSIQTTSNAYTVPNGVLSLNTQYYWRIRYKGLNDEYSEWSQMTKFTTAAVYTIKTPVCVYPNGETDVELVVFLTSDEFTSVDITDRHVSSHVQIYNNLMTLVYEKESTTELTMFPIIPPILEEEKTYYWRVRYKSAVYGYSDWSSLAQFTTSIYEETLLLFSKSTYPHFEVRRQIGDDFYKLDDPSTFSADGTYIGKGIDFNNDVTKIFRAKGQGDSAQGSGQVNYITRSINDLTFVNNSPKASQSTSATNITLITNSLAISPDSRFLAFGGMDGTSTQLSLMTGMWDLQNLPTWTEVLLPNRILSTDAQTTSSVCGISWHGDYVAYHLTITPFLKIWKRNPDNTFTDISGNIDTLPTVTPAFSVNGTSTSCKFSPDGSLLVLVGSNTPFIQFYQRSGDNFTLLPGSFVQSPTVEIRSCCFDSTGNNLFLSGRRNLYRTNAYSAMLTFNGTQFVNNTTNFIPRTWEVNYDPHSVSISHDNNHVAFGFSKTDETIVIYKRNNGTYQYLKSINSNDIAFDVKFFPKAFQGA